MTLLSVCVKIGYYTQISEDNSKIPLTAHVT